MPSAPTGRTAFTWNDVSDVPETGWAWGGSRIHGLLLDPRRSSRKADTAMRHNPREAMQPVCFIPEPLLHFTHDGFVELARELKSENIAFAFGIRGNRADLVRESVRPDDTNIRMLGFASETELEARLGAADIHMVSLRPEWEGLVVPSKFFGSLAVGRPILFEGPSESAIARWIHQYQVGWVLNSDTKECVAEELKALAHSGDRLKEVQKRCLWTYQKYFSKKVVIDRWDRALREL